MGPTTRPTTYQDVKATLHWYMAVVALFAALFVYIAILPRSHRESVDGLFNSLPTSGVVGSGLAITLFAFLAWFLIFFFEAHDKFYDKYIIRWRYRYDIEFLLPKLYQPYEGCLDQRFWELAAQKPYEFTEPFYRFVGDSAETKINENLIVRFYERITKYWITQIHELVLLALGILIMVYGVLFLIDDMPLGALRVPTLVVLVLLLVNRLLVRSTRNQVARATASEIEDIHGRYPKQLKEALSELHSKEGLVFDESC